ncbi:MAG TPA: thymidine phosphorylase [Candidatus Angelobacter sp.]|nr:thymidine phosphorylase [Candidatus Angelobacter sp.]
MPMRLVDLIRKKRDGNELSPAEIEFIVGGYAKGDLPDYQMSAWLMAAWLRGLSRAETASLTQAMLRSGEILEWSEFPQKKVDKHSTGGVGDKTSLILTAVVAAGGLYVPMISGRGLGHTGGTLDKLESIPGFNVRLSSEEMRRVMSACGACMIGQTDCIVPADKKMYALRDVTGTVESPSLICASIMSKKLAEGIDALVLDVKVGSGAFMKNEADAAFLAELMVETGERMGKKMVALLTDMDQPLGIAVGNALEVVECMEVLKGGGPRDLVDLSLELSAWMFTLGGRTASVEEGKKLAGELIADGAAFRKFCEMARLQGADIRTLENTALLPAAAGKLDVPSKRAGYVSKINVEQIGIASLALGGGRATKEDVVDPAVGIMVHKKIGDHVEVGEPLCTLHYNRGATAEEARNLVLASYEIGSAPLLRARPLIHRVIQGIGREQDGQAAGV